nr:FAR1 DNA binding domain, zinc finger, SWIM-type, MULE transposase domain, FHY3/FAR1 family [Tanacetum cinerariifolium]
MDNVVVDPDVEEIFVVAPKFKTEEGCKMIKVKDKNVAAYRTLYIEAEEVMQECNNVPKYKVLRSLEDGSVKCTFGHFLRYGFLCRHVFCVLKNRDNEVISKK